MRPVIHCFGEKTRRWLTFSLIALALSACSIQLPFGGGIDAADRVSTLEVELAQARGTATVEAGGQPDPEASPGLATSVQEDFSSSADAFATGDRARVEDGALLLGPYDECANDVPNFDEPVGCLVVCTLCGDQLSEFSLEAEFTFEEGLSDREFGLILRFVDEDGDRLLDREDYLLALGFNFFENRWRLYLHETDQIEPWRQLTSDRAGFLQSGRLNRVAVRTARGGEIIQVELNDARILNLTGESPQPGEVLVEPWTDAGAVGFLALGRRVTGRFDNFSFTADPP